VPALSLSLINPALEQHEDLPASDREWLASQCPSLLECLRQVPDPRDPRAVSDRQHGREEHRTLKTATVAAGLRFLHAAQAIRVTRRVRPLSSKKKWRTFTVYAVTSLTVTQAAPAQLAGWIRGHWHIEAIHHIRDVT
jgi:Transposase DDE domain